MAKLVSDTYGQALFELALENNCLDEITNEVTSVKEAFVNNAELLALLNHPKISKLEKTQVVENVFKNKVSDMIVGLLTTMIDKSRTAQIIQVLDYFLKQSDEYRFIGNASVISAVELSASQKDDILTKLIATTKYKSFKINYEVDKDIIGGLIIRIGDRVVDSSIKTKLEKLSKDLMAVQL